MTLRDDLVAAYRRLNPHLEDEEAKRLETDLRNAVLRNDKFINLEGPYTCYDWSYDSLSWAKYSKAKSLTKVLTGLGIPESKIESFVYVHDHGGRTPAQSLALDVRKLMQYLTEQENT